MSSSSPTSRTGPQLTGEGPSFTSHSAQTTSHSAHSTSHSATQAPSGKRSQLIFLGSGSSTGVPTPLCVLQPADPPCAVCHKAIAEPPEGNRNYRCNPSLMICYVARKDPAESGAGASLASTVPEPRFIQIDCGKCFREQVLRWYIRHKIPRMDALILTHEHADAMLGLDDIRGLQPFFGPGLPPVPRVPVFVTQHSMDSVIEKFGYLVSAEQKAYYSRGAQTAQQLKCACASAPAPAVGVDERSPINQDSSIQGGGPSKIEGGIQALQLNGGAEASEGRQEAQGNASAQSESNRATGAQGPGAGAGNGTGAPAVFRRVTQLDWRVIAPSVGAPFETQGLKFTPLPVIHGEDYISLGFEFGEEERVVYLSDVSRIPGATQEYLDQRREALGRPAVAIVDALHISKPHETHFSMPQALEAIRGLRPLAAFLIGMTHQFDHDKVNQELREWSKREGINVELSYDGLAVPVDL